MRLNIFSTKLIAEEDAIELIDRQNVFMRWTESWQNGRKEKTA